MAVAMAVALTPMLTEEEEPAEEEEVALELAEDEDLGAYLMYQYNDSSDFFKDMLGPMAGKAVKEVAQEMEE
jgi:hypothetical protein